MAALDFPTAPTVGQVYPATPVAGQAQYQWNGVYWIAIGSLSNMVLKTGDTMSGDLTIAKTAPSLFLTKPDATSCSVYGYKGASPRWIIQLGDGAAESGGNAGSNFNLGRYNDAGVYQGASLNINRATGVLSITGDVYSNGLLMSQKGRIISYDSDAGFQPSVGMYAANRSTNYGFWNSVNNYIAWGSMDSGGTPASQGGFLSPSGTVQCTGTIQAYGGRIVSYRADFEPSVTCWYGNAGMAAGMSCNGSGYLTFAAHGSDGSISSTFGYFTRGGQFWSMNGVVSANSAGFQVNSNSYANGSTYVAWMLQANNVANYTANAQICYDNAAGRGWWRFNPTTYYDFDSNGAAWKPGGGSWTANSDARIKTVHGEYGAGLRELLLLRPVVYSYKCNDVMPMVEPRELSAEAQQIEDANLAKMKAKKWVGLVAQEAEFVMPEIVSKIGGWIDGEQVDDLRGVDTSPLVFALINAVKELSARVQKLEAKR